MALSNLPKVLLEILDEELEKTAKRTGWDVSHQLLLRRGGFPVLVKRVAKYEVSGERAPPSSACSNRDAIPARPASLRSTSKLRPGKHAHARKRAAPLGMSELG